MKLGKFSSFSFWLCAVGIFTFLYTNSRIGKSEEYHLIQRQILKLRALSSALDRDILRTRLGTLKTYDPLVTEATELEEALPYISTQILAIEGPYSQELQRHFATVKRDISEKIQLVEQIKSHNSVLRNSIGYISLAAKKAFITTDTDSQITAKKKKLLELILLFQAQWNSLIGDVVQESLQAVEEEQEGEHSADQQFSSRLIIAHARAILLHKSEMDRLVDKVLSINLIDSLTSFFQTWNAHFEYLGKNAAFYQKVLFGFSLFLLGYVGYILVRLRTTATSLQIVNSQLQEKILLRNQELEEIAAARALAEENSRQKSRFLANMSHELRTPMNGIIGMIELALGTSMSDEQKDFISTARESAVSLLAILNDILDLSKIESGKLSLEDIDFDLRETLRLVERMVETQIKAKSIEVVYHVHEGVPYWVKGDVIRFRQVLLNLIGNAIKFTPSEGAILLHAEVSDRDENGTKVHIAITDTGIGIPEAKQEHIFEAFAQADSSTTRKFGGTGLGLAICRQLVHLMGGDIWVESIENFGSAFHFTVQFQNASLTNEKEVAKKEAFSHLSYGSFANPKDPLYRKLCILVAEDNRINQKLISKILEKAGHEVTLTSNGLEAIAALSREKFDIVLMDVQMPEMDGLEATQKIRTSHSSYTNIPIIALTAHALKGDDEICLHSGMNGYVTKPIEVSQLFATIDNLIGQPSKLV